MASNPIEEPIGITYEIYQGNRLPSLEVARRIIDLFRLQYPSYYPPTMRQYDLVRYERPEQIIEQIQNGNTWITAILNGDIVGIEKCRPERRSEDPMVEEHLTAWTIVDPLHQKRGLGKALLRQHEAIIRPTREYAFHVFLIGDVHVDNTASRRMCSKFGYSEEPGRMENFLFVRKKISPL